MLAFSFPGSPTLFYGDEAGMQGFEDPLNRGTYPWGKENTDLVDFYRTLGKLRKERTSLQQGDITYLQASGGTLVFRRTKGSEVTVTALNAGDEPVELVLSWDAPTATDAISGQSYYVRDGLLHLYLPANGGKILL